MDQPTQWLTREKDATKRDLIQVVRILTIAMHRFANEQNDQKVFDVVIKNKSDLTKMSEADLLEYSHNLLQIAEQNMESIAKFSITAEFIGKYKTLLVSFEGKIGERRLLLEDKKMGREYFKKQIKMLNAFLRTKLDWSIESYREKAPEMVNHYYAARKLPKTSTWHYDVRGFVVNSETEEPVALGEVTVEETGQSTHITPQGKFNFKQFPEGEFTLKIENLAYKTQLVTIRRYAEQHIRIKVKLEAMPVPHPIK